MVSLPCPVDHLCCFGTIHERDRHPDNLPDTARQQEPRCAASLGCSRAAKAEISLDGWTFYHSVRQHRSRMRSAASSQGWRLRRRSIFRYRRRACERLLLKPRLRRRCRTSRAVQSLIASTRELFSFLTTNLSIAAAATITQLHGGLFLLSFIFIFIHHNGSRIQYKNTLTNKLN